FCSDRPDPKASALGERAAAGPAPHSDIWVVSRTEVGWGEPTSLGAVVNSDRDDYYPTLTLDGTLYFSSNRAGSLGQNDVYRARRRDGRWTAPENLGAPVNTAGREYDPFIAADESYLIFASERPGGFGGADLYLSVHEPDGSWGEPRNLGPAINTAESEYTPMLSPDGKYLFFTPPRPLRQVVVGRSDREGWLPIAPVPPPSTLARPLRPAARALAPGGLTGPAGVPQVRFTRAAHGELEVKRQAIRWAWRRGCRP
ncbi:MAG: hypothetical protein H6Q88_3404, partial [Anaeromyxobacteraceae bacterium]|nr:hypothetical protein [Anaeromyxobacteraceae bacterium]